MYQDVVFPDGWTISSETPADYQRIDEIDAAAFREIKSDLVTKTRETPQFRPDYSLVARYNGVTAGHLLLNPITVVSPAKETKAVIIAPLAIDPAYQGQKAGSRLVETAIARARQDGMPFMLVMGGAFYEAFGFTTFAHDIGIFRPHPLVGKQIVRVLELTPGGLDGVMGVIHYPDSFRELVEKW